MLCNLVLDKLAVRFTALAKKGKWGKKLQGGTWVSIILFADNYRLVATDPEMLGKMTMAWLLLLGEYGWETPMEELTWCTTRDDGDTARIFIEEKHAENNGTG